MSLRALMAMTLEGLQLSHWWASPRRVYLQVTKRFTMHTMVGTRGGEIWACCPSPHAVLAGGEDTCLLADML